MEWWEYGHFKFFPLSSLPKFLRCFTICLNYYILGGNPSSYKVLWKTHASDKFSAMAAFLLSISFELLIFQDKTLPSRLENKKPFTFLIRCATSSVFLRFAISPRKRGCQTPAGNRSVRSGGPRGAAACTDWLFTGSFPITPSSLQRAALWVMSPGLWRQRSGCSPGLCHRLTLALWHWHEEFWVYKVVGVNPEDYPRSWMWKHLSSSHTAALVLAVKHALHVRVGSP